jgi:SAM-dependent methyltransferase
LKQLLKRWILAFVAPRPLIGVAYLPRYFSHWRRYGRMAAPQQRPAFSESYPCLTDWVPSTPFDPHYFHQGAWLARRLREGGCAAHVDVGSSVMMASVLSAQVPMVFVDYRPLRAQLPGLVSVAGSILCLPFGDGALASVSSLHVIEHIGLGRYGDPLDVDGSAKAARELVRVLAPGGRLYISVPTGRERVCFNAHRVFSPAALKAMFAPLECLAFALVDDAGRFHPQGDEAFAAGLEYGCGMYVFGKP